MVRKLVLALFFLMMTVPCWAATELDATGACGVGEADNLLDESLFSAYVDLGCEDKIGTGAAQVAAGNHAHTSMASGPMSAISGAMVCTTGTGQYTAAACGGVGSAGLVKWGATGIPETASAGTDYQAALTNPITGLSTAGYWPYFSDTTALLGSAVTASKVVCSDGDAHPVACTNLTDVVPLVAGGALGTPASGTLTNCTGLPAATGVAVGALSDGMAATTQAPGDSTTKIATTAFAAALGALKENAFGSGTANYVVATPNGSSGAPTMRALVAADMPLAPTASQNGGTLTGNYGYYLATGTTTFTLPTAAAGKQFCFRQANAGTSAIKITPAAGDAVEKTDGSAYCGTAKYLLSSGANGDQICLVAIDTTYWMAFSSRGTWTCEP